MNRYARKTKNGNFHSYYFKNDNNGIWIVWESPFKKEMFLVTQEEKDSCKNYWQKLKLFNKKRQGK